MYPQTTSYYQQQNRNVVPLGLKGYPVSSLEEARAAVVDFDGSMFFFPDIVNKRIYTKQINLDGTAILNMYEQTEIPMPVPAESIYVTKEDLSSAINELKSIIIEATMPPEPQKMIF